MSVVSQLKCDLETRHSQLHNRLTSLRAESEEVWKTLETAEKTLMDMISAKDYDVTPLFAAPIDADGSDGGGGGGGSGSSKASNFSMPKQPEAAILKLRADRQETEDFYLDVNFFFEFLNH